MQGKNVMPRILITFFLSIQLCMAQNYTDYKPQYTEWVVYYIVDKIEYTSTNTIFYFRYIGPSEMNFLGLKHEYRWCLENVENPEETFYVTDIRNISVNGLLKLQNIGKKHDFLYQPKKGDDVTCEVHFPRLPKHIRKVHFLEGKTAKNAKGHFHALDVELKTFDDSDLGTEYDAIERVILLRNRILDFPKIQECKARM